MVTCINDSVFVDDFVTEMTVYIFRLTQQKITASILEKNYFIHHFFSNNIQSFLHLKNSFFLEQCDKAQIFNNTVRCYNL